MSIADPRDPLSLSNAFRRKRDARLRQIIQSRLGSGTFRILDLGGSGYYWERFGHDFLDMYDVEVTMMNIEPAEMDGDLSGRVFAKQGDACSTGYPDNAFDFVHSNSLVEHLRSWDNMKKFAREVRRLAPSYYVQTPSWWFPVDPHFYKVPGFHWMPRRLRRVLLQRFPVAYSGRLPDREQAEDAIDDCQLLSASQLRQLFPDARIEREKVVGLTKSLIAVR